MHCIYLNEHVTVSFYKNSYIKIFGILYFNNPGISQISFLTSLYLMIEQMSISKIFSITKLTFEWTSFFFSLVSSFRYADDSTASGTWWNVLFEIFPSIEFSAAMDTARFVRSDMHVELVFWAAHFGTDFAFETGTIVNVELPWWRPTRYIKNSSWHWKISWDQGVVKLNIDQMSRFVGYYWSWWQRGSRGGNRLSFSFSTFCY